MTANNVAFTGSVPENYDRYLGPMLFEPYADDLAKRIPPRDGLSVLEVACGTGIVTAKLRAYLPASARLIATDLNEGMLKFGEAKRGAPGIEWQIADMMALQFADESFDCVVCQFGMMFVPDKTAAMRELRRVLKPGGRLLFNVWDSLAANGFSRIANDVIKHWTQPEPVRFYEAAPFAFSDEAQMRAWLNEAAFSEIEMTPVELECVSPSASDAAIGLVQGTPVVVAVKERDRAQVPLLTDAVARALAVEFGERPCRGSMRALVWEATR